MPISSKTSLMIDSQLRSAQIKSSVLTHPGDNPSVNIHDLILIQSAAAWRGPGPSPLLLCDFSCCFLSFLILLFLPPETAAILGSVQERWRLHYCPPHNNGCHPRGRRRGRNPPCLTTSLLASPVEEKLIEKVLQRCAELKWLKRNLGEKRAVVILPDSEGDEAELSVSEPFGGAGNRLSFSRLSN